MAKKRKTTKKRSSDPGTMPGLAAAGIVLLIWGFTYVSDLTSSAAEEEPYKLPDVLPNEDPTAGRSPGQIPQSPAEPVIGKKPWEESADWDLAVEKGDAGIKQMEKTRKWHENVGGDPFRYRAEMNDARDMLEESLAAIERLKEEFSGSRLALNAITGLERKYSKPLGGLRKESR